MKLHLLYDPRQARPVWSDVTSAKLDDVVAGRACPLEGGATYVFDKGYNDFCWWAQIIKAEAFFVTRRKKNTHCRQIRQETPLGENILADRRLNIGHRRPHAVAGKPALGCRVARGHRRTSRTPDAALPADQ